MKVFQNMLLSEKKVYSIMIIYTISWKENIIHWADDGGIYRECGRWDMSTALGGFIHPQYQQVFCEMNHHCPEQLWIAVWEVTFFTIQWTSFISGWVLCLVQ